MGNLDIFEEVVPGRGIRLVPTGLDELEDDRVPAFCFNMGPTLGGLSLLVVFAEGFESRVDAGAKDGLALAILEREIGFKVRAVSNVSR